MFLVRQARTSKKGLSKAQEILGHNGRRPPSFNRGRKEKGLGKLDQGTAGRPGVTLSLGGGKKTLTVPTLVDTGAEVSVIDRDLARQLCTLEGRPYLLTRACTPVHSATGHGLQLCGIMEIKVSTVGLITLHVVKNLPGHQCILGWDMLDKFGFSLDTEKLTWGGQVFKIVPYQVRGVVAPIKSTTQDSKLQALLKKYKEGLELS